MVFFFSTALSGLGLKLKPYERCISNKVADEHQCTIGWFMDYNKVSHMDNSVNSMIADNIEEKMGSHIAQQKRSTCSLVWASILSTGRKSQCPCHITLMRI